MKIFEQDIMWAEFKQGIRSLWDLSETEIDASGGDISKLENIVINKYIHENPETIHEQMLALIDSYDNPTDRDPHKLYQSSFARRPPVNEDNIV